MVATAEKRLADAGIELPPPVTPFGAYVPAVRTGNLLFLSGMLPTIGHDPKFRGRLGRELNSEQGCAAARAAALNALAVARQHLGSLDRISRVARLGVYMATAGRFRDQVKVADAASELLRDILGVRQDVVAPGVRGGKLTAGRAGGAGIDLRGLRLACRGRCSPAPRPALIVSYVRAAAEPSLGSISIGRAAFPGFGHSDWPDPKQFAYTFDHYAELMNHFTETLGLSRYTLYMQDYGGPVGF